LYIIFSCDCTEAKLDPRTNTAVPELNEEELPEVLQLAIEVLRKKHVREFLKWDAGNGLQLPAGIQLSFQPHDNPVFRTEITWNVKERKKIVPGTFYSFISK